MAQVQIPTQRVDGLLHRETALPAFVDDAVTVLKAARIEEQNPQAYWGGTERALLQSAASQLEKLRSGEPEADFDRTHSVFSLLGNTLIGYLSLARIYSTPRESLVHACVVSQNVGWNRSNTYRT